MGHLDIDPLFTDMFLWTGHRSSENEKMGKWKIQSLEKGIAKDEFRELLKLTSREPIASSNKITLREKCTNTEIFSGTYFPVFGLMRIFIP